MIVSNNLSALTNVYFGDVGISHVLCGEHLVWPEIPNYLSFTALEDNSSISMTAKTSPNMEYSLDGINFTTWDYSKIALNSGDTVYFRGDNTSGFSTSHSIYNKFKTTTTGKLTVQGNIMSLLSKEKFEELTEIPNNSCFYYLFSGCTSLVSAERLLLPATSLTSTCYRYMFQDCTSMEIGPSVLPAITLKSNCYDNMFNGCLLLKKAPELYFTTAASFSCQNMFRNCALTEAPKLRATNLDSGCYWSMFYGCKSLTEAPELIATTLKDSCYHLMFQYCSSLKYIKAMFTTTPSSSYTGDWVQGVASSGIFVKNPSATWNVVGDNGVPTNWVTTTHDLVDLDLPSGLLWAKCNVGATSETGYGNYYSKDENDSAIQTMGGNWRMPTIDEFNELTRYTDATFEENFNGSGINGCKFTNKKTNKYVFFPCAGYNNVEINDTCYIWPSDSECGNGTSTIFKFEELQNDVDYYRECIGDSSKCSIRGVMDKPS